MSDIEFSTTSLMRTYDLLNSLRICFSTSQIQEKDCRYGNRFSKFCRHIDTSPVARMGFRPQISLARSAHAMKYAARPASGAVDLLS